MAPPATKETTSLGYINCDIFVEGELYPFTVQVKDIESDVFIILDSLNSVIYPNSAVNIRVDNDVTASRIFNLPKNKAVTIVSYKADAENRHQFGITKSNTSKKEVLIDQEIKTLNQIKDAIKQLCGDPTSFETFNSNNTSCHTWSMLRCHIRFGHDVVYRVDWPQLETTVTIWD